MFKLHMNY